jgi:hypothetical protein
MKLLLYFRVKTNSRSKKLKNTFLNNGQLGTDIGNRENIAEGRISGKFGLTTGGAFLSRKTQLFHGKREIG